MTEPTIRKPIGILAILALIAVWSVLVVALALLFPGMPRWAEPIFYVVAGIGWIVPLGPLLHWMETGRWR